MFDHILHFSLVVVGPDVVVSNGVVVVFSVVVEASLTDKSI